MEETIEYYKKKVAVLEQRLAIYEKDSAYRGYYALNKMVNLHIDIINDFKLKDEIEKSPKDDKKYDRVKGLWEGLRGMITDTNALKTELSITGNEEKDTARKISFLDKNL